jgi:hypothetical protein
MRSGGRFLSKERLRIYAPPLICRPPLDPANIAPISRRYRASIERVTPRRSRRELRHPRLYTAVAARIRAGRRLCFRPARRANTPDASSPMRASACEQLGLRGLSGMERQSRPGTMAATPACLASRAPISRSYWQSVNEFWVNGCHRARYSPQFARLACPPP